MTTTPLAISYTDPDSIVWNLSDYSLGGGYIASAISGIEGIPVAMQTLPLLDGTAIPNFYIPQPGTINLAILVTRPASDNEDDYYTLLDSVVRAFLNRRNEQPAPGYLTIQRPNGDTRQIPVYTTSGLDTPVVGPHSTLYTLTLNTPDPFWSDVDINVLIYKSNVAPGILPMLPIHIAGSTVFGDTNILNQGSALSYPTWYLTGPGTPTIQNLTTGRSWALNTAIPSGNVVQVVTQPGQQMAVNITTATNIWDQLVLASLSSLWPLVGGNNEINIMMAGSTAATSVEIDWANRWSRALWPYLNLTASQSLYRLPMAPRWRWHRSCLHRRARRTTCGLRS